MLREWMLGDYYFGETGMGAPRGVVSGMFVDDDWNDKGLTEEGIGWQKEMGLSARVLTTPSPQIVLLNPNPNTHGNSQLLTPTLAPSLGPQPQPFTPSPR